MKYITPKKAFVFLILTFAFLFITNGVTFIQSDGYAAFHTADSIIDNFDFVYRSIPEHYDYRGHVIDVNEKGEYSVVYPPGDSILNTPLQFVAKLFESDKTIYNDYYKATNGHTFAQGLGFLVTANIFGLMTLVLMYWICVEVLKKLTDDRRPKIVNSIAIASAFVAYASSYAIWYVMLDPAFNHTYELFAVCLMIFSYIKYLNSNNKKYLLLTGFALGLATLIRPVLFVLGIGIIVKEFVQILNDRRSMIDDSKKLNPYNIKLTTYNLLLIAIGGLPSLVLFMWYNLVSYGKLFASGYSESRGETFQFSEWNGLRILFSLERGWFVYSPIFLVGVIALLFLYKKSKFLATWALTSIFFLVLIYGFWPSWWAGGSYGHRFMIPIMPFAMIGIVYVLTFILAKNKKLKLIILILIILCTSWSLLLTLLYRFTPVAELRPKDDNVISGGRMWLSGDRYTPFDILKYHTNLIKNSDSAGSYVGSLIDGMNGGNSFVPIFMGKLNSTIRIDDRDSSELKFLIIKSPFKKYELTAEVEVLIKDNESNKIYKRILSNLENQNEIMVDLAQDNLVEELKNPDEVIKLSAKDYKAFSAFGGKYEIYFKDERSKLFFRGHPIYLTDGETEYKL